MKKIFVSIACFMDNDIVNTIEDCLNKARFPENIIFGICLQSNDNDKCLDKYKDNKQFKIKHINWSKARGPAYARGIIYDMFTDEDYFFQIDCHTRFYDNWDKNIISCFDECKKINNKAIISHYPVNINNMGKNDDSIVNITTVRCIDINMGIKTHGRHVSISSCPMKSWGISAAMLFFDRKAYYDIPFDKDIYFGLQFEEQVVLSARFWTSGYDIFTPSKHIIGTEYLSNRVRQNKSVPLIPNLQKETYDRLCHIMKLKYIHRYEESINSKLGDERTIEDYYKMLNIYDKVKKIYPDNYLKDDLINKNVIQSVIINLETATEKYKKMSKKLNLFNIPYTRFNAILGSDIYHEFKASGKFQNNGYTLRPHQIGCWQSHYKIWKHIISNNIDKLFIFEDDCFFVNDFRDMYDKTLEMMKNKEYDILFLGYSGANIIIDKELHLLNYGAPRCTHAYILTLSGAKKLIKKMSIIDYPIDEIIGRMFNRKELKGYRTSYILIYQPWQRREDKYSLPSKYVNKYNDLI